MDRKREKGSLTVEAALFLVIFLMAFLTIINFARLARAEVIMQHAINGTAMQISQYGYLLTKTGMYDAMTETANRAKEVESDIDEVVGAVNSLSGAIENTANGGITQANIDELVNAVSESQGAVDITREYFQNPKGLLTGLAAVGKHRAEQAVCSLLVARMAESQVEAYLKQITDDPDAYLIGLGIEGGMDGLDFRESKLMGGGSKDISVTVRFKVKNQMFPLFDFGEHEMCLNASTRFW